MVQKLSYSVTCPSQEELICHPEEGFSKWQQTTRSVISFYFMEPSKWLEWFSFPLPLTLYAYNEKEVRASDHKRRLHSLEQCMAYEEGSWTKHDLFFCRKYIGWEMFHVLLCPWTPLLLSRLLYTLVISVPFFSGYPFTSDFLRFHWRFLRSFVFLFVIKIATHMHVLY